MQKAAQKAERGENEMENDSRNTQNVRVYIAIIVQYRCTVYCIVGTLYTAAAFISVSVHCVYTRQTSEGLAGQATKGGGGTPVLVQGR